MSEPSQNEPRQNEPAGQVDATPGRADTYQMLAVAVLMVLIIATLFFLWRRERARAIAMHRQVAALQAKIAGSPLAQLESLLGARPPVPAAPVDPNDLFVREAVVDGRPRAILCLPASVGRRLGLPPGELFEVGQSAGEANDARNPADAADKPSEAPTATDGQNDSNVSSGA